MSTKITYDGNEIANFSSGGKVLKCEGKTMNTDVIVETTEKEEQSKTLTLGAAAPSTVTPDSGKVLSSVPVVLDTSVIKAENIAKGVTMLGVTGTHEGGGGGETCILTSVGNREGEMYVYAIRSDGTVLQYHTASSGTRTFEIIKNAIVTVNGGTMDASSTVQQLRSFGTTIVYYITGDCTARASAI